VENYTALRPVISIDESNSVEIKRRASKLPHKASGRTEEQLSVSRGTLVSGMNGYFVHK
jgi:hypothetical protein